MYVLVGRNLSEVYMDGGFTPCTSLRAVHGATHGWHVSDVPYPCNTLIHRKL